MGGFALLPYNYGGSKHITDARLASDGVHGRRWALIFPLTCAFDSPWTATSLRLSGGRLHLRFRIRADARSDVSSLSLIASYRFASFATLARKS